MSALIGTAGCGPEENRSVDWHLEMVEAIGEPDFDPARKEEPGYMDSYREAQHQLYRQKAAVLLELARSWPDDERVPEWLKRRWKLLGWNQAPADVASEVLADIEAILEDGRGVTPEVAEEAQFLRARYGIHLHEDDYEQMVSAALDYADAYPDQERSAELLALATEQPAVPEGRRRDLLARLAADYPDTHWGVYAPGQIRQIDSMGEPFELEFVDFVTGDRVSVEGLAGSVVVLDFWATTCAPCVADLPELQAMYERYRDRGLEILGISLDEPDFEAEFRERVTDWEIEWPQYYQGGGYLSDFSVGWGIGSAPSAFVLDREGRLRHAGQTESIEELERVVVELLEG